MQRQISPASACSEGGRSSSGRRELKVGASFVHVETSTVQPEHRWKSCLKTFMQSPYLANAMALIVLIDAFCTCADIDAKAARKEPSDFVVITGDLCLGVYTLEALLLLCLFGIRILRDWMTLMDISIVACGWAEATLEMFGVGDSLFRLGIVRALRLVRIFRLIRLVRRIRAFRELHKLVMMMATCMKTLAWSFLTGYFDNCPWCQTATSSVMDANLLLFKTVVAGDSWGEIAVPVIQKNPATLFIFVGSLLTLVFGVLNVIVAVVVDTFADARQRDVQNLADELDDDILADKKDLQKIFDRIDVDGSGQLTLEELIAGARSDSMFQSRLRVMDIDENDLTQLFGMIDSDGSGTIEVAEFLGPLSRWAHDSKTAPRFIKYNLLQSINLQEDLYDMSSMSFSSLAQKIDDLQTQFQFLRMQISQKAVADRTFDMDVSKTKSLEAMRSINSATSAMMPLTLPEKSAPAKAMPSKDLQDFKDHKECQELTAVDSELDSGPSPSKIEMPHASKDAPMLQASHFSHTQRLESRMEATIARIEARLEGLWQLSLRPTALPATLPPTLPAASGLDDSSGSLHSGQKQSQRSLDAPHPREEESHARRRHKDMFKSMYMDKSTKDKDRTPAAPRRTSVRKNDKNDGKRKEKENETHVAMREVPMVPISPEPPIPRGSASPTEPNPPFVSPSFW